MGKITKSRAADIFFRNGLSLSSLKKFFKTNRDGILEKVQLRYNEGHISPLLYNKIKSFLEKGGVVA